ncbi:MAG: tyrosine-type recombinase/integrase [Oscillospiraceae bacterium]|nr:tyrosine-type recombinase/integrase [Oscillospiraceae bacterium]
MQEQKFYVQDVLRDSLSMLERQGYAIGETRKYQTIFRGLAKFSQSYYGGEYSIDIGEAFIQSLRDREIPLSDAYIQSNTVTIQRANRVIEGDTDWRPSKPSLEYEDSIYSDTVKEYAEYLRNSGKTKSDIRSRMHVVARFLRFTDDSGVIRLDDITAPLIYAAFRASGDKNGFRKCVGAFFRYAHRHGLTGNNFSELVPSGSRHTPVPTVYTPDEIEKIIIAAAASKKTGKRNKAIVLIAARLGLRSCDIANLRFDSLNREKGMIEITQVKTKEPLTLPLLPEILAALDDYIENERAESGSDMIFLSNGVLHGGPIQPHTVYCIVSRIIDSTGIDTAGRKRGAHALRSSLATALLGEGYNHHEVKEALGQKSPEAVKFYAKTEVERLRDYALPVPAPSGIFAKTLGIEVGV